MPKFTDNLADKLGDHPVGAHLRGKKWAEIFGSALLALGVLALVAVWAAATAGYESTSRFSPNYNLTDNDHWFSKFIPGRTGPLCQPAYINTGQQFRTTNGVFLWEMGEGFNVTMSEVGNNNTLVNFNGTGQQYADNILEHCDLSGVAIDMDLFRANVEVKLYATCIDPLWPALLLAENTYSVDQSKLLDESLWFTNDAIMKPESTANNDLSVPLTGLANDLWYRQRALYQANPLMPVIRGLRVTSSNNCAFATDDRKGCFESPVSWSNDSIGFFMYQNLTVVRDNYDPVDWQIPTTNFLNALFAAARYDFGANMTNNLFVNADAKRNLIIGKDDPALDNQTGYLNTLDGATAFIQGSEFDPPKISRVRTSYLCQISKMKPPADFAISVLGLAFALFGVVFSAVVMIVSKFTGKQLGANPMVAAVAPGATLVQVATNMSHAEDAEHERRSSDDPEGNEKGLKHTHSRSLSNSQSHKFSDGTSAAPLYDSRAVTPAPSYNHLGRHQSGSVQYTPLKENQSYDQLTDGTPSPSGSKNPLSSYASLGKLADASQMGSASTTDGKKPAGSAGGFGAGALGGGLLGAAGGFLASKAGSLTPKNLSSQNITGLKNASGGNLQGLANTGSGSNLAGLAGGVPGLSKFGGLAGKIPGASNLQGMAGNIPGASNLQGMAGNIPGASNLQGMAGNIPGASNLQGMAGNIPGASNVPGAAGNAPGASGLQSMAGNIPGTSNLQGTPGNVPRDFQGMAGNIPGAANVQGTASNVPGASNLQNFAANVPGVSNFQNIGPGTGTSSASGHAGLTVAAAGAAGAAGGALAAGAMGRSDKNDHHDSMVYHQLATKPSTIRQVPTPPDDGPINANQVPAPTSPPQQAGVLRTPSGSSLKRSNIPPGLNLAQVQAQAPNTTHGIPTSPGAPAIATQGIPTSPGAPAVGTHGIPTSPGAPAVGTHGLPTSPGAPARGLPTSPGAPVMGGIPTSPGAPQFASMSQPLDVPEAAPQGMSTGSKVAGGLGVGAATGAAAGLAAKAVHSSGASADSRTSIDSPMSRDFATVNPRALPLHQDLATAATAAQSNLSQTASDAQETLTTTAGAAQSRIVQAAASAQATAPSAEAAEHISRTAQEAQGLINQMSAGAQGQIGAAIQDAQSHIPDASQMATADQAGLPQQLTGATEVARGHITGVVGDAQAQMAQATAAAENQIGAAAGNMPGVAQAQNFAQQMPADATNAGTSFIQPGVAAATGAVAAGGATLAGANVLDRTPHSSAVAGPPAGVQAPAPAPTAGVPATDMTQGGVSPAAGMLDATPHSTAAAGPPAAATSSTPHHATAGGPPAAALGTTPHFAAATGPPAAATTSALDTTPHAATVAGPPVFSTTPQSPTSAGPPAGWHK